MNTAIYQAVLDEKFASSYAQLANERKSTGLAHMIELAGIAALIGTFILALYFVFWGAGFSMFAKEQHDSTVSLLTRLPGPQAAFIQEKVEEKGYLSLVEYRKSVAMANEFKFKTPK